MKVFSKAFSALLLRFADGGQVTIKGINDAEPGMDHAITEVESGDETKVRNWLEAHADSDLIRNGMLGEHEGEEDGKETAEPPPPPASSEIPAPSTSDGSTGGANPPPKDAATKPAADADTGNSDSDKSDASSAEKAADQSKVDKVADKIEGALKPASKKSS